MANLFDYAGLKNKPKRNGFDLSRKNIYSISAGELLPVLTEEMLPGDSFTIDLQSFTRSQPMNTAAFARMRQYYDFFVVPYHLLWSRFPNFITDVPNNQISKTSAVGSNMASTPYAPLFDFDTYLHAMEIYGDTWGLANHPTSATAADIKKYFDPAGRPYDESSYKLLSYLGYPVGSAADARSSVKKPYKTGSLSPFRFLAYQKIYADYYRFSQWEQTDSALFNVDFFDGRSTNPLTFDDFAIIKNADADQLGSLVMPDSPFTLRYANFKRDLLRGVMPSQQFGGISTVSIDQNVTKSFIDVLQSNDFYFNNVTGNLGTESAGMLNVVEGDIGGLASFEQLIKKPLQAEVYRHIHRKH